MNSEVLKNMFHTLSTMNTIKEPKLIIRFEYAHTKQEQEVCCLMTPTFNRRKISNYSSSLKSIQ